MKNSKIIAQLVISMVLMPIGIYIGGSIGLLISIAGAAGTGYASGAFMRRYLPLVLIFALVTLIMSMAAAVRLQFWQAMLVWLAYVIGLTTAIVVRWLEPQP